MKLRYNFVGIVVNRYIIPWGKNFFLNQKSKEIIRNNTAYEPKLLQPGGTIILNVGNLISYVGGYKTIYILKLRLFLQINLHLLARKFYILVFKWDL